MENTIVKFLNYWDFVLFFFHSLLGINFQGKSFCVTDPMANIYFKPLPLILKTNFELGKGNNININPTFQNFTWNWLKKTFICKETFPLKKEKIALIFNT